MNEVRLTVREILLCITGAAIGLLLVSGGNGFYHSDYRAGVFCFAVAALLGFAFFRKRRTALVVCSCSCILALVTLGLPFHPSFGGLLLLLGSATILYATVYLDYEKYPYLSFKHVHTLFESDAAMAAENARIEAEARELVRKRPYGPWLFR
jgi:hypothetical protein